MQSLCLQGLAPDDQSEQARESRIAFWRDGTIGNGNRHDLPNEPGGVELTPLGRKIAQLDPWPDEDDDVRPAARL